MNEMDVRNAIHDYLVSVSDVIHYKQRFGQVTEELKRTMTNYLKKLKEIDDETMERRHIHDIVDQSG